jgi:hypothetical protein
MAKLKLGAIADDKWVQLTDELTSIAISSATARSWRGRPGRPRSSPQSQLRRCWCSSWRRPALRQAAPRYRCIADGLGPFPISGWPWAGAGRAPVATKYAWMAASLLRGLPPHFAGWLRVHGPASRDHARERTIGYVLTHWHGEARRDLALGGRSGGGVEGLNGRGDSGAYAPSLR